ncbi:hypothetical protein ACOJCA_00435, partial [Enterobacter sp. BH2-YP2023]
MMEFIYPHTHLVAGVDEVGRGPLVGQGSMQWRRWNVLTRDFLMKADCKTAFGAIEESLLWSAEQRAAGQRCRKRRRTL